MQLCTSVAGIASGHRLSQNPEQILADQGTLFMSQTLKELHILFLVVLTTAYAHQGPSI